MIQSSFGRKCDDTFFKKKILIYLTVIFFSSPRSTYFLKSRFRHFRLISSLLSRRLQKVLEYVTEVHSLCGVLGLDFGETVSEVHPSLQKSGSEHSTNISDKTLQGLEETITKLYDERDSRHQKLKDVMSSLSELWNLMDTPETERRNFSRIAQICRCSSDQEIREQGALSLNVIGLVTAEVERLTKLKAGRMKELVMKRRN